MRTQINLRTLRAVAIAMSTEDSRYYLNGVLVECRADSVTYVATDGHRMIAMRMAIESPEEFEGGILTGDFIIPAEICNAYKPTGKSWAGDCDVLARDGESLKLAKAGRVFKPVDGTFPDWRRCVPRETSGIVGHYNATYVGDFAKFLKLMGQSGQPFIQHNGESPALVRFASVDSAFAVLMPMRMGAREGLPAWMNETATVEELSQAA